MILVVPVGVLAARVERVVVRPVAREEPQERCSKL